MNTLNATYTEKEQDYKNESTRYWFDVETNKGIKVFGVVHTTDEQPKIIDSEGYPIEKCNYQHEGVLGLIDCVTEEMINEQ